MPGQLERSSESTRVLVQKEWLAEGNGLGATTFKKVPTRPWLMGISNARTSHCLIGLEPKVTMQETADLVSYIGVEDMFSTDMYALLDGS